MIKSPEREAQILAIRTAEAVERLLDPRRAVLASGQGELARRIRHETRRDQRRMDDWYQQLQDMEN